MTEKSDIVDRSLKKVAKGTGIAAIGLAASLLFAFLGKLMVARYWTEGDYGIFSLAIAVLMICSAIGTLGLEGGLSRSIAYARSKNLNEKILGFMRASIQFAVISAVILSIVLFFIADILAESVFHEPALGTPLRVIALAIPFLVLARVIVSIFLGFERIKPPIVSTRGDSPQPVIHQCLLCLLDLLRSHLPAGNHICCQASAFEGKCI